MRRVWSAAAVLLLALTGCGIEPSGVTGGGSAPTGVASGATLYYLDEQRELQPHLVETGRLGTIDRTLTRLFTVQPDKAGLHTEVPQHTWLSPRVTMKPDVIDLMVPFAFEELTPPAIDQIVCTALGVHVQSGGATSTKVQVRFVQHTPESRERRTCPLIG